MTKEENLPKGQTQEVPGENKPQPPQSISVEQVLNQYPIDRERGRDALLIEISKNLGNIAVSLDHLVRLKMERINERKEKKDEAV